MKFHWVHASFPWPIRWTQLFPTGLIARLELWPRLAKRYRIGRDGSLIPRWLRFSLRCRTTSLRICGGGLTRRVTPLIIRPTPRAHRSGAFIFPNLRFVMQYRPATAFSQRVTAFEVAQGS